MTALPATCEPVRFFLDRFGLSEHTLEHIGKRLGITRERVRQIEVESLARLASLREIDAVSNRN